MSPQAKQFYEWLMSATLSEEERTLCTGLLLEKLGALPLRDILYTDPITSALMVGGKELTVEGMKHLHESARAALSNKALSLIREQVAFEAQNLAVRKVMTIHDLNFARAALWWGDQVQEKLELLAQQGSSSS